MTNPTLERAARAAADVYFGPDVAVVYPTSSVWTDIARAVLMAVLPELKRYDPQAVGCDSWMAQINDGEYIKYDDIALILKGCE